VVDQKGKDGQQQQPGGLWAAGIFFVALVFLFIVLGGYVQGWEWTGLSAPKQRTLWDWLDLLIVPVVLAIGAYLFTRFENRRTQKIANQRSQDDTLQAYLDHIGSLLLDENASKELHNLERENEEPNKVRTLARARTLTALDQVGSSRKGTIVTFLREAHLILIRDGNWEVAPIIGLSYANLKGASLANAFLKDASLSRADLRGADLSRADLRGANLFEANLFEANLSRADLRGANLRGADLMQSDMSGTKLFEANLFKADLSKANLFRAQGLTDEQLSASRHF
jgi:Pentapeptide repeats (8 copies)